MKRTVLFLMLILIFTCAAGCGRGSSEQETSGSEISETAADTDALAWIGEDRIAPEEAKWVWRTACDLLREEYPDEAWFTGGETDSSVEKILTGYTERILRAGHDGDTVDESQALVIHELAESYPEEDRVSVEAALTDLYLAGQLWETSLTAAKESVSEEDARVVSVMKIRRFYTGDEEQKEQKKVMDQILQRLNNGTTFGILASNYQEEDEIYGTVVRGAWDADSEAEIFSLEAEEVTGILNDGESYWLIRCVSPKDETASSKHYLQMIREEAEKRMQQTMGEDIRWQETALSEWLSERETENSENAGLLEIFRTLREEEKEPEGESTQG